MWCTIWKDLATCLWSILRLAGQEQQPSLLLVVAKHWHTYLKTNSQPVYLRGLVKGEAFIPGKWGQIITSWPSWQHYHVPEWLSTPSSQDLSLVSGGSNSFWKKHLDLSNTGLLACHIIPCFLLRDSYRCLMPMVRSK